MVGYVRCFRRHASCATRERRLEASASSFQFFTAFCCSRTYTVEVPATASHDRDRERAGRVSTPFVFVSVEAGVQRGVAELWKDEPEPVSCQVSSVSILITEQLNGGTYGAMLPPVSPCRPDHPRERQQQRC